MYKRRRRVPLLLLLHLHAAGLSVSSQAVYSLSVCCCSYHQQIHFALPIWRVSFQWIKVRYHLSPLHHQTFVLNPPQLLVCAALKSSPAQGRVEYARHKTMSQRSCRHAISSNIVIFLIIIKCGRVINPINVN